MSSVEIGPTEKHLMMMMIVIAMIRVIAIFMGIAMHPTGR